MFDRLSASVGGVPSCDTRAGSASSPRIRLRSEADAVLCPRVCRVNCTPCHFEFLSSMARLVPAVPDVCRPAGLRANRRHDQGRCSSKPRAEASCCLDEVGEVFEATEAVPPDSTGPRAWTCLDLRLYSRLPTLLHPMRCNAPLKGHVPFARTPSLMQKLYTNWSWACFYQAWISSGWRQGLGL